MHPTLCSWAEHPVQSSDFVAAGPKSAKNKQNSMRRGREGGQVQNMLCHCERVTCACKGTIPDSTGNSYSLGSPIQARRAVDLTVQMNPVA
jgi:hypothetical protein